MPDDLNPFARLPEDVAVLLRGYRPLLAAGRHGPTITRLTAEAARVDEVDVLATWAAGQHHNPAVGLPLTALRHTALGTGLHAEELNAARGTDVTTDLGTGAVLVAACGTAGGHPTRTVPVLAGHEKESRRRGPGRGGGRWLLGPTVDGNSGNVVTAVNWLTAHLTGGTRPDTHSCTQQA